jgi:hypothetical protein
MLNRDERGHRNLYWDFPFRLAPPRRVDSGRGFQVRVSEDARKCSVFVGYHSKESHPSAISPTGTGFLVFTGEASSAGIYLVTAGHVAKTLGADPFVIRFNDKDGAGRLDHIDNAEWHYHDDESVDVAVMQYMPPDWADCSIMPASEFVDDFKLQHYDIGPGDAAYLVGLFHLHVGKDRNLVTVHTGHIALMPTDEKLETNDGAVSNVYLIEMQTLPGSSGSPVYIRPTIEFMAKDTKVDIDSLAHAEGRDYLLGVWIAAWPGKPDKILAAAKKLHQTTWIPVGMGIVVPASAIKHILESYDLVEARRIVTETKVRERMAILQRHRIEEP